MQPRQLATDQEWDYARKIIQEQKDLSSGFKIDCQQKEHIKHLSHSFLYLSDEKKNILVSLARHYWLGHGSFGIVKIAEDALGKLYAIKISQYSFSENEITILKKTGHFYFTGSRESKKGSKYYILQEYFDGISLREYLALHTLDEQQKKLLAHNIGESVLELQRRTDEKDHESEVIVHGDITPANFILNKEHQIKIVDFGGSHILKTRKAKYTDGHLIGALAYRAPEANKELCIESDTYSLGTLFKKDLGMSNGIIDKMCSQLPENRPNLSQVLEAFHSDDPVKLPNIDSKQKLINEYQKGLKELRFFLEESLSIFLAEKTAKKKCLFIKDNISGLLSEIPYKRNFHHNINQSFEYTDKKMKTTISTLTFVKEKYQKKSLLELRQMIPKKDQIENPKISIVNGIKKLVKFTNSIEELNAFFNWLRSEEYRNPILMKENNWFMGNTGKTTTWKLVVGIIKDRAYEIAQQQHALTLQVEKTELFTNIFQEKRARLFKFKSKNLSNFENMIRTDKRLK